MKSKTKEKRKDNDKYQRVTTWLDSNLVKLARSKGSLEDKELSEIVDGLLKEYTKDIVDLTMQTRKLSDI